MKASGVRIRPFDASSLRRRCVAASAAGYSLPLRMKITPRAAATRWIKASISAAGVRVVAVAAMAVVVASARSAARKLRRFMSFIEHRAVEHPGRRAERTRCVAEVALRRRQVEHQVAAHAHDRRIAE